MRTPVYLDHHATTPLDPRVAEVIVRTQRDHFGNPASSGHAFGWAAAKVVETARAQVAALIGAEPREIVFTSGATEADNLAVFGVAGAWRGEPGEVVVSGLEHDAVAGPCRRLGGLGWRIVTVPPGSSGLIDPADVERSLTDRTALVAVLAAQNEIGTIQPLAEIAPLCRRRGVPLLTDAAQAAGRIPLDVKALPVDLLALSGHKIYGPKGVGALFVSARVDLQPHLHGGGQERGLRPGTLNVPGIAGLGEACRLAALEMEQENRRVAGLRDRLWRRLSAAIPDARLNGAESPRLAGNLNVSFPGLESHGLLAGLTVLAVSSGSACSSGGTEPSAVLRAIGLPDELARASLRIGLGRFTTGEEVDFAADTIARVVAKKRGGDPV